MKKTVTERALLARINRKLAKTDEVMKKCRADTSAYNDFGDYYIISLTENIVSSTHVDLDALSRDLGVLQSYEVLED